MLEEEWVHSILLLHRIHTNKIKTSQILGRDNLNFQELTQAQVKMYNRTLTVDSELGRRQKEQEKRQITVVEKLTLITVNMAREEFPHINAARNNFSILFNDSITD